MTEPTPPIVQLTLRGVPFLDELVYFVKSRASTLASDLGGVTRCVLLISVGGAGLGGSAYVAELQVEDEGGRSTVQTEHADLFDAIDGAFREARGYLIRTSAQERLPALMT